jgi:EmrB/QacA subfamily drug resistance transporter
VDVVIIATGRGVIDRPIVGRMTELSAGSRRWAMLAVVSAAQFLVILDLWVANIALPRLQHVFAPATLADLSWILNIYAIVVATLLIPAGGLADRVGRRTCFLAGAVVFGLASLGCAVAPTLPVLIAFRALQAAGGALLIPTSLGLALSAFPVRERGTAVGVWAAVGAFAASSGPVLGGLLVERNWRLIFLVNVPVVLATLAAGTALLPRQNGSPAGRRFDALGTLLVLGAIGSISTALTEVPAWPPALTWPVLTGGLVLVGVFAVHVTRHPNPVVVPRLFSARRFRAGAAGLVTYYAGFAALLLGTTLLLTERWHYPAMRAALGIAPGPLTAGVLAPLSGRVSARFGKPRTIVTGAALFAAAGVWRVIGTGSDPAYLRVVLPSMLLWGVANALIQAPLFACADAVPRTDLASGSAVLSMARQLGSVLGVAVLVAMLGTGGVAAGGVEQAALLTLITAGLTACAGLATGEPRRGPTITLRGRTPVGNTADADR